MSTALRLTRPSILEWCDITLHLGEFSVNEINLVVEPEEWVCIVGPTGAGKTLVLEIATGFLEPSAGSVVRHGRDVTCAPPESRRIAYVPQDDLLFPHLSVRKNLAFSVRRSGVASDSRLHAIAAALGIAHLLDRRIDAISGGEAQRVALGRAMMIEADVLLIDECTSALDEDTRAVVGDFMVAERDRRGLAVVQVTHDRSEAMRLADRIVTMERGRISAVAGNLGRQTTLMPASS